MSGVTVDDKIIDSQKWAQMMRTLKRTLTTPNECIQTLIGTQMQSYSLPRHTMETMYAKRPLFSNRDVIGLNSWHAFLVFFFLGGPHALSCLFSSLHTRAYALQVGGIRNKSYITNVASDPASTKVYTQFCDVSTLQMSLFRGRLRQRCTHKRCTY